MLASVSTNLSPESVCSKQLLYFPALVTVDRPSYLSVPADFGWCAYCRNRRKFLTRRYQDSVLLDMAYCFCKSTPTPPELERKDEAIRKLDRSCKVWKNGIHWTTEDGIQAMVQFTEENRCILFSLSWNKECAAKCLSLRSSVIALILAKKSEHCPSVDVTEYLISPSCISQIPRKHLSHLTVFELKDVARCELLRGKFVLDVNQKEKISPPSLLFSDPYLALSPAVVQQLFDGDKSNELVPVTLLTIIRQNIGEIFVPENSTHQSLQKQLNMMSVFAGRNPLVSVTCMHVLSTYIS